MSTISDVAAYEKHCVNIREQIARFGSVTREGGKEGIRAELIESISKEMLVEMAAAKVIKDHFAQLKAKEEANWVLSFKGRCVSKLAIVFSGLSWGATALSTNLALKSEDNNATKYAAFVSATLATSLTALAILIHKSRTIGNQKLLAIKTVTESNGLEQAQNIQNFILNLLDLATKKDELDFNKCVEQLKKIPLELYQKELGNSDEWISLLMQIMKANPKAQVTKLAVELEEVYKLMSLHENPKVDTTLIKSPPLRVNSPAPEPAPYIKPQPSSSSSEKLKEA